MTPDRRPVDNATGDARKGKHSAPTWFHPIYGRRPLDMAEAMRMVRILATAYGEVIDLMHEYDEANPEVWSTCSEHPGPVDPELGGCGMRDLPDYFTHALITSCDVRDAKTMLEAWKEHAHAR